MATLLSGGPTPLNKMLKLNGGDEDLTSRLREIVRRALTNAEEKGLETLFVALGMASWSAEDKGRPTDSPILLLPVKLESKGQLGRAFSLVRTGIVQVNLVLFHVLETQFSVKLAPEELIPLLQGDDEGESFDPVPVYNRLLAAAKDVPGFEVKQCAVLGNFAFQKMAMVKDLQQRGPEMAGHDIIAGLAGDADARRLASEAQHDVEPRELDRVLPEQEFLILDADSSQQRAMAAVLKGDNAVIHGPPGTGKSQTIANLIASLAAEGKRVLFVAEKRAALEVVRKRLKEVGLEHLSIDLHGADVAPKRVMKEIGATLEAVRLSPPVDCETVHRKFQDRRERMNSHVERLHRQRPPSGKSVYEMQGTLLRLEAESRSGIRWRGTELDRLNSAQAQKICDLLVEAGGFGALFLRTSPSPWTGALLPDGASVQAAIDKVSELASRKWPAFVSSLDAVLTFSSLTKPTTLETAKEVFNLLVGVHKTFSIYSGDLFRQDLEWLRQALSRARGGWFVTLWAWCTSAEFRSARQQVRSLRLSQDVSAQELFAEISAADEQRAAWRARSSSSAVPAPVADFSTHRRNFEGVTQDIAALQPSFSGKNLSKLPLEELGATLVALAADSRTPHQIPQVLSIERQLNKAGASAFVAELRSTRPPVDRWTSMFDFAWLSSCLDAARAQESEIAGFNGRTHDGFAGEFVDLDEERIRIATGRVRRAHAERVIAAMNAYPDQEYLVRAEAQKRSRHLRLRDLFARAPDVLTTLCPCWMASPLSVSQLLDAGSKHFDVVIFDEASQILPEDAVPSLLRASRAVVAGDSQQLPPTTFFATGDPDEELADEAEIGASEGFESLLDMMNAFLRSRPLEWHYRSHDESLISFSNHYIYNDRLVTFPGPGGPPSISHVLVQQTPGVDGEEESSSGEIRKVVALILEHATTRPLESLGVIAMGIRHSERIQRALDAALDERPNLAAFFDPNINERFFVKNLERVQGDERDAIILSIGYGKDRGGNLPFRFGPLVSLGGRRRLNVAVTRARKRLTLVSSFSHLDMDLAKVRPGTGVELLRNYLMYAASNGTRLGDAQPSSVPLNAFEADVHEVLTSRGLTLIPQVGASSYRIDLVAQHPQKPGRLVLAIECDGASYHSSPTARDRDRLRQQVLERLGWRFCRIWSTDWFMRKDEEAERVLRAFRDAVDYADRKDKESSAATSTVSVIASAVAPERQRPSNTELAQRRGPRPAIFPWGSITDYPQSELVALIRWLSADGQLRTDDQILEAMVDEMGFARRGARIESAIRDAIALWRKAGS